MADFISKIKEGFGKGVTTASVKSRKCSILPGVRGRLIPWPGKKQSHWKSWEHCL